VDLVSNQEVFRFLLQQGARFNNPYVYTTLKGALSYEKRCSRLSRGAVYLGLAADASGCCVPGYNCGTTTSFKICLPARIAEEKNEEIIVKEMPRGGCETILLVDDEELIRYRGSTILSKSGYKVVAASNGKEALDVYEQRGGVIALVVLDLVMPEMGGKQCLEGLLRLDPAVKAVIASSYPTSLRRPV
jgi:two-component system, cell cycle sensor histidine kinase and response regulator CckA